ncbi:putative chaperonin Cpn60/TCP-1 family, groEL-like equatorial domain superfamily [Dioscorea sansibarensis]
MLLMQPRLQIEEGVVVGGGCTLLRLSTKMDSIKASLDNDEEKIGADIFKHALSYPSKLIVKNAGMNGSVIVEKLLTVFLSTEDFTYGYNAAKNCYEDLIAAGILDPTKVVRCCLENAASVAKTFLTSDIVVVEMNQPKPIHMKIPPSPYKVIPKPGSLSCGPENLKLQHGNIKQLVSLIMILCLFMPSC